MSELELPTYEDIKAASNRLKNIAHKTPVFTSTQLNEELQCQVFIKCENFQKSGSFKFRGAYNILSQLNDDQKEAGIITFSSGNHAGATALAGKLLGVPTTILMPQDAPKIKIEATKSYGGEVQFYDREKENRECLAQRLQRKDPAKEIIPPYNHKEVIAG